MGRWLVFVVVLLWSGVAGASVTMTPSTVAVGNVVVNTSANNTGTLSGTAAEHVDLVIGACSGAGAGTFVLTPNVNVNLTSAKTITVSYTPTARGARSCTVNVYDTGTTTTLTTFTITGTGVAPVVSPAPTSLSLGVVRYNDAAATHTSTQNLVISNVGDAGQTLTVSSVTSNNPDYTIIPPGSNTINSGGSGTWVVTFNPSMPGADNAVLTIASNDPVTPMKTVNATGTGGTAVIGVTATLNFGIINNGTASTTQNIVVSNNGAGSKGPMAVTQATFVNNTAGWFKFTQAGCVGSTTTCALAYSLTSTTGTVGVQCAPPANAMGTQTAQVTISSDADDTTMSTTSLMCTAGRADLVAPTTPLSFANQPINTTSAMQPVMIQNTGNATLTYGLAMAGTDASQFVITGASGCTSNCTVSANSSVMVNVAFRPTSTGSKNATFRITPTNDPDTVNVDVPVSGTGIAPIASLNVTSMTFGNVDVGTTATAQTLTVTNTGTADLLISAATMFSGAADYVVPTGTTGSGLSINVAPNMSVSWTIACKPTTFASRPGTFRITSNTNNAPGTNSDVALTCTGLQGILTASPTSYDFMAVNQGNMVTHDFTITNTGNTTVTNIASALSGTGVGYSVVTGTIAALAGGASTTVTVQFYPMTGSDGGPKTVTFSGSWGTAGTASAPITLNGDGLTTGFDTYPSPPNAKDFGDLRFDATATGPVNVINTAGTTYHINTLTITPGTAQTGEFTILSCTHNSTAVTCPTMAQPFTSTGINDTLVLSVRCDPNNRVAMLDATLTVTTDLPTNPSRVVPLKCNSVTAGLEVDPATNVLDFGATDLDAPTVAVTRTINLKNTGTATLNLSAATKSGAGLALYTFSATPATAVAPNATFPIDVTYTPLTEKPSNQPDVASIMIPVTGVYGGPNSITIQISGYGADRHIAVAPAPVFPPTFRNPGDAAPIMPVTITNNGDFPLAISAVMLSDDPVWTLVNPDPVTIPGRGTYDFNVKFSPVTAGKAPTGHLMIMDDDNARPSVAFDFDGTGLDRNVSINPTVIDFGYAPIGGEVKLSEVSPTTPLAVTNMETAAPIMIHSIQIDGEGFTVFDPKTSASPNDFPLDPGTTKGFDVTFSPDRGGTFEATATLYLDMDPSPQATIQLRGHAATVDVHGGGGCSAGHDLGGGALILIAVVLVLRRRRGAATARAAAVVLVVGATATSRADDIDSETFRPTPAIGAFAFQLEPAGVGKEGEWAASALMSFASNSVAVQAMDSGSVVSDERPVTRRTGLELGGAYAFLDRFEAGVRVPLYSQQGESDSMTTFHIPAAKGASLGDIAIHARAQLAEKSGLVAGAGLHLTLPTSKQDQFVGLDAPSVQLLALVSYKLPKVTLGANAGAIIRKTAEYENDGGIIRITQGSGFAWSVGAAFRANERLSVSAEMFGEVNRGGFGGTGYTSPADGLVGLHYGAGSVTVGLAVGRGISRALGTPDIRGVLEVAFSPLKGQRAPNPPPPPTERDTDDDGIVDANDKCPTDKEDHIGNVADGCPLLDTDHDGVADADDKCPLEGEDKDAFQDEDGCPDLDDDADTIPDTQDKCPDAAETINGVDDNDGCPDKATTTAVDVSGSKTPQQAAEEAFKQGRVFIKEKNFAQACSAFELSQRLDPQFGTQYNLAGCYVELGKLATALNLYRELGRTDSNAARKTAAADNAKRLAPRVPKVVIKLKTAVPGAQIFMNNVDSTALVGLEIPVDLGRYEVVAGATNYKPFRTSFEVKEEAKTTTITVDLQQ